MGLAPGILISPGVSVVICCYNSRNRIVPTLDHLASQKTNGISWELIIVDNNSDDGTLAFAVEHWRSTTNVNIKAVLEKRPGLKYARETGIGEASFDFVVFVDDDNHLASDYINRVFEKFSRHPDLALIGGNGRAVSNIPLPPWFEKFQNLFAVGPPTAQSTLEPGIGHVFGAGMAVRRSAWVELTTLGFIFFSVDRKGKELSGGQDVEVSHALRLIGYKVEFNESMHFDHFMTPERLTWAYLKRLTASSSRNFLPFVYYAVMHLQVGSTLRFVYIYLKRLTSDILHLFRLSVFPLEDKRKNEIEYASAQANFIYLLFNMKSAVFYFRHVREIQRRSKSKK